LFFFGRRGYSEAESGGQPLLFLAKMFRESRNFLRNTNSKSNKRNTAPEKLLNLCLVIDYLKYVESWKQRSFFLLTAPRFIYRFYGIARWRKYVTSCYNISPLESNVFTRLLIRLARFAAQ
jgi:hypothetical protein